MNLLLTQQPKLKPIFDYLCSPLVNNKTSDVTIYCCDGILLSHQIVLASISQFLGGLFQQNSFDKNISLILPDFSVRDILNFLENIYTTSSVADSSDVSKSLGIVEKLNISPKIEQRPDQNSSKIEEVIENKSDDDTLASKRDEIANNEILFNHNDEDRETFDNKDWNQVEASIVDSEDTKAPIIIHQSKRENDPEGLYDNPDEVDYFFLKTGKSGGPGILVTHGAYKWHIQAQNVGKDIQWYTCSRKKSHGCLAKATTKAVVEVDNDTGEEVINHKLVVISGHKVMKLMFKLNRKGKCTYKCYILFQHHYLYHEPEPAAVIASVISTKMKEAVRDNPGVPVRIIKKKIHSEEMEKLDPEMAAKVEACFPKKIETTLQVVKRQSMMKLNEMKFL